ncbi:dihydroxyacetone kinase family protein [Spirilliplanes yamanashiensis]|uniref:Erythrulose kinase n=1 Tax=Spirilliplanes yamanashiensis TaxID=42233 RepID=A0A8J3YAY4_9ACTN|nr:dihydroxyacetone kinase family protein [Spirilliplanes yamanashiensis]MDP9817608.1 dihydroxyacetone kinase [Spirilliplanes yamanashiensis]GIJ04418.1 erythrulose kinase [Spirilliplanes yamanashiensis]
MTYVYNSERAFKDDTIDGLCAAYGRYLRRVPGTSAVASVSAPEPGRVSTIVGGGSGHYPSFAGLVGPGLADAAVCGDVFTSPSAEQAHRTIRAVDGGAGVLMLFGNYAGDVMHFGLAADLARAQQGIDARIVLVTDDIASAPPERAGERRGIAGDFFVFRAAASAAHRGDSLDEVERAARHCNDATRTIGVAFDGLTVPGRDEPLFTVEPATMVLGLGIHGEPGIQTMPLLPADDLGRLLVARLLAERPPAADRARVLVNGLGRVKYEELFILYRAVAAALHEAGVRLTEPEIGEFVTSLDMGGCSVTLVWTDDELEELLSAPCAAPGYNRPGPVPGLDGAPRPFGPHAAEVGAELPVVPAGELAPSGRTARAVLAAMGERLHELEKHLGDLDAVAADGDHGTTMTRGMDAALHAADRAGPDAAAVLRAAGMAFADAAGGASGALWGSGLTTVGALLGAAGDDRPGAVYLAGAFEAAREAVIRLGGSVPGDKTMVDALDAFVREFRTAADGGARVTDAWSAAAAAARAAAEATKDMRARRGRAARLADRSVGTLDPGAVSLAESLTAAGAALRQASTLGTPS